MLGVLTAKLVSRASRVSSKGSVEAAAASCLQGALAGQDDNPLFLGGIRVPPAETITDAMGAAIATGTEHLFSIPKCLFQCRNVISVLETQTQERMGTVKARF